VGTDRWGRRCFRRNWGAGRRRRRKPGRGSRWTAVSG
jgi:hypothetical protein